MAFPWIFESTFEQGSNGEWDSETDTASQLSFPHYSELSRHPTSNFAPFSGAYCCMASLTGGTADAILLEGDINIANTITSAFAFNILFSNDFASSSGTDVIHLLELTGSGTAVTGVIGCDVAVTAADGTLGTIRIGIGDNGTSGAVADTFASTPIERGQWYTIENVITLNTGGSGTSDLYITKAGDAAQATADIARTSRDMIVVTDGEFGMQAHASTTTGFILLDNFIQDDLRIYVPRESYPREVLLTKSGHAFVGPGEVSQIQLLSGPGADNVLTVYDTDIANTNSASNMMVELKNLTNNEIVQHNPANGRVTRGCYVSLSGTSPRALVTINKASAYWSAANVRLHGSKRHGTVHDLGVTS